MKSAKFTLIGGPTVLVELGGLRFLTDPTFSPPGEYASGTITLTKLRGPAMGAETVGAVDAVLLSHDQHADNLDPDGRRYLESAPVTYTTRSGAQRLGGRARALDTWETVTVGDSVSLTATPARHGPAGIEPVAGEVTGFALGIEKPGDALYLTGDSVFYDGIAQVAQRFSPRIVVVFAGAARTRGPFNLTMATNDALDAAAAFPNARIVAVHTEGWAHFTEDFEKLETAFTALGERDRLVRLEHGAPASIPLE